MEETTPLVPTDAVLLLFILLFAAYDVWLAITYGTPHTYSGVLLRYAWKHPWVPIAVVSTAGVLLGHVFSGPQVCQKITCHVVTLAGCFVAGFLVGRAFWSSSL